MLHSLLECYRTVSPVSDIYQLAATTRNHPRECHESPQCKSLFFLVQNLAVHYQDARKVYKYVSFQTIAFSIGRSIWILTGCFNWSCLRCLAAVKHIDALLSDLDTAVATGDLVYLLKLLNYSVPPPPQTFKKPTNQRLITEETMKEVYGTHLFSYFQKVQISN